MKGVQCHELIGGMGLKNHAFLYSRETINLLFTAKLNMTIMSENEVYFLLIFVFVGCYAY